MTYKITVSNLENNATWTKDLDTNKFDEIKDFKGYKTVSMLGGTVKPIRTNSMKNFSRDFFLPTTVNHAFKVQSNVQKVFAILGALALDLPTFPLRLVTFIPRTIGNACKKENLLKKYLLDEKVDSKLLASDHVKVKLEWETTSDSPTSFWTDENGIEHYEHSQELHLQEENINFIEVPTYKGCEDTKSQTRTK